TSTSWKKKISVSTPSITPSIASAATLLRQMRIHSGSWGSAGNSASACGDTAAVAPSTGAPASAGAAAEAVEDAAAEAVAGTAAAGGGAVADPAAPPGAAGVAGAFATGAGAVFV